jgi:hypothetical protein
VSARATCSRCGVRARGCIDGVCPSCLVREAIALAQVGPRRCEYGSDIATHLLTWPSGGERVVCLECCMHIVETAARLQGITLVVSRLEATLAN